ncbi:DUF5817 domain-containing protein [Methanolobus psychrotolerans]|uniref:DUF5817 domain-containing protein n=1 Tax=Methanolobus psychrotolerans TaxID=1874706 RepID=UPI000B919D54|nr:hypothetical protein [Methanolobus psychrotolerans]
MTYVVIVCTKCRKNAQIIEIGNSKTTRCQKCNANLIVRKLRVFFSSEKLEEAISIRTQIQATIAENGTFTLKTDGENSSETEYQVFGDKMDAKTACFVDTRKEQKKKKTDELIIGILQSNNKQMHYAELKNSAIALDIDEKRFDEILKKMLRAGEIYSPSKDIIRTV